MGRGVVWEIEAAAPGSQNGFFPMKLENPDQLAEMVAEVSAIRRAAGKSGEYDFIAALPLGTDPVPYAAVGATWWLAEFPSDSVSADACGG